MKSKIFEKTLPKLDVQVKPMYGKEWVIVKLKSLEWVPSFEELFWILRCISGCENKKYPRDEGFKGWEMVAEFAHDACKPGADFEELAKKYKIPDRRTQ